MDEKRDRDPETEAALDELTDVLIEASPLVLEGGGKAYSDGDVFVVPLDDAGDDEHARTDAILSLIEAALEPDPEKPSAA